MTRPPLPHLLSFDTPGIHPLPAGGLTALVRAARAAGVRLHRIDLRTCRDKADLLKAIATGLAFPAWFGHNWDALADCLGDLSWHAARHLVVVFEHAESLIDAAPGDYLTALEIFAEAAAAQHADGRRLLLFAPLPPTP
jgi:RNAse (barnase) inhibitor barstar